MGRPAIIRSDAQINEVETLAAVLTAEQVADYFGIGRRTFYEMMHRDEEIAARYKRGKAKAIGFIAQGLINKARSGDTTSMIFFLKTQAGWRETVQVKTPERNRGDSPAFDGLSDEMLAEMIAVLRRDIEAQSPELLEGKAVKVGTCNDLV